MQPSIISSKALLTFCTRTMDANSPRLRQVHALVDELKARPPFDPWQGLGQGFFRALELAGAAQLLE